MAWRRTGDKALPGPMMTQFTDAYMRQGKAVICKAKGVIFSYIFSFRVHGLNLCVISHLYWKWLQVVLWNIDAFCGALKRGQMSRGGHSNVLKINTHTPKAERTRCGKWRACDIFWSTFLIVKLSWFLLFSPKAVIMIEICYFLFLWKVCDMN